MNTTPDGKFKPYGKLGQSLIHVCLTVEEAWALDALAGYSTDSFLRIFYKEMGESYLRPHEAGLRSLFAGAAKEVGPIITHFSEVEAVFRGGKVAVRADDLEDLNTALTDALERERGLKKELVELQLKLEGRG